MTSNATMLASQSDVKNLMDQALGSEKGIVVKVENRGKAVNLRQRCYKFRTWDRNQTRDIYPRDDPRYGASVYDELLITVVPENEWTPDRGLIIRRYYAGEFEITPIE